MGTALNKILKDLVLKSKTMAGYAAPYIPGWDCHGLPIEFKVVQKARDLDAAEIRRRCAEFAKGFIDIQRTSFRRLGVFGDWENPYLTMKPAYEANILRVFAKLVEDGAVYQSRKPVQWSYGAYTALAEAEIDYKEKVSTSVFVRFPLLDNPLGLKASMVIWTTTVDAARQRRSRPPSAFHLRGRQVHEERPDGKPRHRQRAAGCLRSENGLGSCGNHP
ncbi:MAG: class I tRNA ligase family protein [Akkermansia sp.]